MPKSFTKQLQERRSQYAHPDQACTQAQSLNLLSSGIYTEEERFVFELLQNAVDAYEGDGHLNVKMVLKDGHMIFMHNGEAFSQRDVEGLCDVGNGNKMRDAKKIGYKGIGFKSVFMHSKCVTVKSGSFCFRFEKDAWANYWDKSWGSRNKGHEVFMPWQIIPIESQAPVAIDTDGYNVVTYISSTRIDTLREKVTKLLNSSNFLLFLRHANITITFFDGNRLIRTVQKRRQKDEVILISDNKVDSTWLVYENVEMKIEDDVRKAIKNDGITPIKLQEAEVFDLSFAIPLNGRREIEGMKDSCVYTYLPTSISFGLPFLVNANFITDAGRQHLVNDSEWNKMIMNAIPGEFLRWMAQISCHRKTYHRALPLHIKKGDRLSIEFDLALNNAIDAIAFIPSKKQGLLKAKEAVMDRVEITEVLPADVLLRHINTHYHHFYSEKSFIQNGGISILREYGVFDFDAGKLIGLFEDEEAFTGITIEKDVELIKFLYRFYNNNEKEKATLARILSQVRFLYAEDDTLDSPDNLFFPSNYREEQEVASGAKVLHEKLYDALSANTEIILWLKEVGLCEMDEISIIKNLFTKYGYVTEDNAIEIGRYIFKAFQNFNLVQEIGSWYLSKIRFITKKGMLKSIGDLFLGHEFKPDFDLEQQYDEDVFISDHYAEGKDLDEWSLFFRKMGICTGISPKGIETRWDSMPSYTQKFLQTCKDTVLTYSNPYMGYQNPFSLHYFRLHYFPLLSVEDTPHGLAKIIWNYLLKDPVPNFSEDRACGVYGCCLGVSFDITKWTQIKYGPWVLKNHQTFPASNGQMLLAKELYKNTPTIQEIFGPYLPYVDVDCEIDSSWNELLSFKVNPPLSDYLTILTNIAEDEANADANKQRISKIYQRIVSDFDYSESKNANLIKEWATTGKLLSREGIFCSPQELRHITLDGFGDKDRVYIGQVEYRERVIDLLGLMGVKIITENNVNTQIDGQEERDEIKRCLVSKSKVLALLKAGEKPSKENYDKELSSISKQLEDTHFYHCSSIALTYGNTNDTIQKVTFGTKSDFFYTGEIRISKIDPLLTPLCKYLQLKDKERELLVTMFEDMGAIREYLKEKEYDVSFLEDVTDDSNHVFTTSLSYTRTDEQRRRDALTGHLGEIIVYEKLKQMGYSPKCLSISNDSDYEDIIEYNGQKYYCKPNYERYDIEFETENGHRMLIEVKSTTMTKESQENMPISYREISQVEEYSENSDTSYVIVRVFNVRSSHPDIFIFKGHNIK